MKDQILTTIFKAALEAADPWRAVKNAVRLEGNRLYVGSASYALDCFNRIIVVGAGTGTAPMARAMEEILGDRIDQGLVVVKYGHTGSLGRIRQVEAAHPLPDEAGVKGTEEIVRMLKEADEKTLVICLLSGGGSALLVSPAEGLSLGDKQAVTDLLLRAGAPIGELNAVRKHLSKVKGGRLAELAHPATLATLILSDVIGDRLDVIASGPTVPDGSTFADALKVIRKYGLEDRLPAAAARYLVEGEAGKIADTPKARAACFSGSSPLVVGSLALALEAARSKAESLGYATEVVTAELQGEAADAARYLAGVGRDGLRHGGGRRCIIAGGETTVTVKGSGKGGRNQEMALAFAMEIEGTEGIDFLSGGTDGNDGPTDAAGAMVDGKTAGRARGFGIEPEDFLARNDSYTFFEQLDRLSGERHHLITGPTGTNVMDVQVLLVEP